MFFSSQNYTLYYLYKVGENLSAQIPFYPTYLRPSPSF